MSSPLIFYWVRRDFRLTDNPALHYASMVEKKPIIPIFFIEPYMQQGAVENNFGWPQRFFLTRALKNFAKQFKDFYIINDHPTKFFRKIAEKHPLKILVNEDVHPDFYSQVKKLHKTGIDIRVFPDQITVPKNTVTSNGSEFSVFSPFKKAVWDFFLAQKPLPNVHIETEKNIFCENSKLDHTNLETVFSKSRKFLVDNYVIDLDEISEGPKLDGWYFTEQEAQKMLDEFIQNKLRLYHKNRNFLNMDGTSKLSLALTWGLISARSIKQRIMEYINLDYIKPDSKEFTGEITFISELIWREFYKYLLFLKPWLLKTEFQENKRGIKWLSNDKALLRFKSWIRGETGYAIVDAAMKEIQQTGFMHNRARMIVASILTKNLGINWRWGQEYFRAALIDLDEASNNGGWQWSASVGADPQPIRIFNPYLQAKKFDPDFTYQRRWLGPAFERYKKDEKDIAPIKPLVEHVDARQEALRRYFLS